jgi:membrane-associated phospholipid phosphatase
MTLLLLGSPAGWFLLAMLPLLAWSRLALRRHSVAEVVIGLVIGALSGSLIILL